MPFHMKTPPDQMVGGGDVSLTLHWNPSMGANWAARFNRAQTMLDQEVLRRTDPYVPLDSGLLKDSIVLLEQVRTLDKHRLREKMGRLDPDSMNRVDQALSISFGLRPT